MTTLSLPGRRKPYVMAHRGNRVACPENTLRSFRRAIDDGADILETDLHLTADEVFVCIHDATIDRTTDGSGPVASMRLAELREWNAAAAHPELPPEPVPTLHELAALLPSDIGLALELKTDRFLEAAVCSRLAEEIEPLDLLGRTVILSFSEARLRAVQAVAPDLPIGLISMRSVWPRGGFAMSGPFWPLLLLNPLYVLVAHRKGQFVCPLDPAPDRRLLLYRLLGCDAVLTDDPASTCRALGRRERAA